MKPRHYKTYNPFCSNISLVPSPSYAHVLPEALRTYPGAKGDAVLALSWLAEHRLWAIRNAINYYSNYHYAEDEAAYRADWIRAYLERHDDI